MENQFFIRQLIGYRFAATLKEPVDAAVAAYCEAVYAEYTGLTESKAMITTERTRLVNAMGWEKPELDVFDRTIAFCESLPMDPMYAESAKGSYGNDIKRQA